MLLRTASAPVLKALNPRPDPTGPSTSISLLHKTPSQFDLSCEDHNKRLSISKHKEKVVLFRTSSTSSFLAKTKMLEEEQEEEIYQMETAASFIGGPMVDASMAVAAEVDKRQMVLAEVGGGVDGGGRGIRGGVGGSGDECWEGSGKDGPQGSESMDLYYQRMIKTYPGDALLLSNYAKFLEEAEKAEEYCGRAILAKAGDGNFLSMYADLVWNNHKDGSRARSYFDQAAQTSSDDCFVLASYAKFLWDAEEEGGLEDDDDGEEDDHGFSQRGFSQGHPPIAAVS